MKTVFALLLLSAVSISCTKFPVPEPDDEGHASFARAVIPMVLGRLPRGVDEIEVVADIAQLHGRNVAVDMLLRDSSYVEHWADALIDLMRIPRDQFGTVDAKQNPSCWGAPLRSDPDPSIAEWVRDHEPTDPGAPASWNMTDLLYSAIALDDLSPLYKANLFPMFMRIGGSTNSELDRRALYRHFSQTYLNRNTDCLKCHNPEFSTTNKVDSGGNIVWRRTWTIPGHPEKALFGNYSDTIATDTRVQYIMRGDVRARTNLGSTLRPWNMSEDCNLDAFSLSSVSTPSHRNFTQALTTSYSNAKFGSLDGAVNDKVSLWELERSFHDGVSKLQNGYGRFYNTTPVSGDEALYCDVKANLGSCTGCHSGATPSANLNLSVSDLGPELVNQASAGAGSVQAIRVVPNNLGASEFHQRIISGSAGYRMPPSGTIPDLVNASSAWINGGAPTFDESVCAGTTSTVPDVDPDEAFAFLTASNLVDGIWMTMMGSRLTIDHGFSRTKDQRDALRNLTEYVFLRNNWSLKSVINKVASSDWTGRRAPAISQQATAYELPLVLDPWVEADPSLVNNPDPHETANGQGELVDRFRVNTLLRNIAHALDWKEPRRFPDNTGYPEPLDKQLGQFISDGNPGFSGVSFQSLLALENEIGLCVKSGKSIASDDWIDNVIQSVQDYNAANPTTPLTVTDVWKTLKDRLVQDPTVETTLPSELIGNPNAKTEAQALVDLFNSQSSVAVTSATSATDIPANELEGALRAACGTLVKTPTFLLTNLTPRGYSDNFLPDPPALPVCSADEPCGYDAICDAWAGDLYRMGNYTRCLDRSVRKYTPFFIQVPPILVAELDRIDRICPPEICGFVTTPVVSPCLRNPKFCEKLPSLPPPVERFVKFKGEPRTDRDTAGVYALAVTKKAQVTKTEGVMYRAFGQKSWRKLRGDTRLGAGDLLYLPPDGTLFIKDSGIGEFGAEPLKYDTKSKQPFNAKLEPNPMLLAVTNDDAPAIVEKYFQEKGELGIREFARLEEKGAFETRAVNEKDWHRIYKYVDKPENILRTTIKERLIRNEKNFEEQHVGIEPIK